MFPFTRQERLVFISFLFIILFGITVQSLGKKYPHYGKWLSILEGNALSARVDINSAGYEELVRLPFIGPATAKRILDYRQERGRFAELTELKNIKGVNDYSYRRIAPFLTVRKRYR